MKCLIMNKAVLNLLGRLTVIVVTVTPLNSAAGNINTVIAEEVKRIDHAAASQKKVDSLHKRIEKAKNSYEVEYKVVKGLSAYNKRLLKTVDKQGSVISDLNQSLEQLGDIERQVVPLMMRMIDVMDNFIAVDIPFLKEERLARQARIKKYMTNTNISVSERFRLVVGAYTQEKQYGKTIDAYSDTIIFENQPLEVDVLRVGRIGLYFQTKDNTLSGVWNKDAAKWLKLKEVYEAPLRDAIRIAQEKDSPDLLKNLPLFISKKN